MKVEDLLTKYRKIVNPPYNDRDFLVIFSTIFILILIPLTVLAVLQSRQPVGRAAGTASMSLSPATLSVNHGDSFTIEIRENSGTEPVNAVQANLTYDDSKLDFVSIDGSESAFPFPFEEIGGGGSVKIARIITGGSVIGNQLVAKVTFTASMNPGITAVTFASGTALVRSTDNNDILGSTSGGTYTIVDPPPTVSITSPVNNEVVSGPSVAVSATATDDVLVTKVDFLVDSNPAGTDTTAPYTFNLNTTTLTNTTHTLTARAYDANGSTDDSITISVDNQPPTAPTALSATAVSGTQINLSWTASTDNIGVTDYNVYRDAVKITTVAATSYNDTGLTAGSTYSYYVKAKDSQGNVSAASNTAVEATIKLGDVNKDGVVNIFDASIMASKWGTADPDADLNGNGVVDIFDASILASNWEG